MDLTNYQQKKAAGQVEIRVISKTAAHIYASNFSADTGERLDDTAEHFTVEGLENQQKMFLEQSEQAALAAQMAGEMLADLKTAIAEKYPPEAPAKGKKA